MTGPALAPPPPPPLLFPLHVFTSENDRNCVVGVAEGIGGTVEGESGWGWGGGHTCSHKTEPRVPISINSSGLASLDASGGWAGVIPVLAVSWQSAEQRREQIETKRKGFEFPAGSTRGCGGNI